MLLAGLSGCASMAPKYSRPASPVPAAWPQGDPSGHAAAEASAQSVKWQDFFLDPKLKSAIDLALKNNRDLRIAALTIEKSRAMYGIQKAEIFPIIGVSAGSSSQRLPADVSPSGKEVTTEQYSVSFGTSSWELDFFGRVRSLKDQALETYLSTEQAQKSVQISLISTVGNAWIMLAADLDRLKFSEKTLQLQEDSFKLIKHRYETGISSELDLRQAQTRMEAARVDTVSFSRSVALDRNLLDLLVGQTLPDDALPSSLESAGLLKKVSAGLSSDILLQRPDILQAENRLKAANASIGAARAAFFPRITLTAGVGTLSGELSGLFKSGSGSWAFAPRIDIPIFDFGRRKGNLDAAVAESKIATAQYEKAIQTAFRETADALAALGYADKQVNAQESLIASTGAAYRIADARYRAGVDNYLPSLDAQRSLYGAEIGLIGLRLARTNAQISLYKALGGGE
jgi:multidrug efflux system outer membrane protein